MSRLFRISGYLEQDGGWPEAGPSLVGEVIMGELPIFWGRCKEFVDGKVEELPYSKALEQEISHTFRTGCPELAEFPEDLAKAAKARRK